VLLRLDVPLYLPSLEYLQILFSKSDTISQRYSAKMSHRTILVGLVSFTSYLRWRFYRVEQIYFIYDLNELEIQMLGQA